MEERAVGEKKGCGGGGCETGVCVCQCVLQISSVHSVGVKVNSVAFRYRGIYSAYELCCCPLKGFLRQTACELFRGPFVPGKTS